MSFRTRANLVQFVAWPTSIFILFFAFGQRHGVVFAFLALMLTALVAVWLTCLRCPRCKAWLIWQRLFLVYLRRFCESCGYDLAGRGGERTKSQGP